MIKKYWLPTAIVIVVGAAAFFGGTQYQKTQAPARTAFNFAGAGGAAGAAGRRGGAAGAAGGGALIGQVMDINSQNGSMTVSTPGNGSKIVFFSTSTMIMKTTAGSMSDLATGTEVIVAGSSNSDGSVTAQTIQIRPAGAGNFPGGGAGAAAGASTNGG